MRLIFLPIWQACHGAISRTQTRPHLILGWQSRMKKAANRNYIPTTSPEMILNKNAITNCLYFVVFVGSCLFFGNKIESWLPIVFHQFFSHQKTSQFSSCPTLKGGGSQASEIWMEFLVPAQDSYHDRKPGRPRRSFEVPGFFCL